MNRIMGFALAASLALGPAAVARAADPDAPFGAASAVAGNDLAKITGKADTSMTVRANNSSTVAGNAVIGQSQTGTINFDSGTFQNMAGMSLLSANTGNNVSINSSLNVNVSITPR